MLFMVLTWVKKIKNLKKKNILQRINEEFMIGPILGIVLIRILIIVLELLFQCKVFLVIWLDHVMNKVNAAT